MCKTWSPKSIETIKIILQNDQLQFQFHLKTILKGHIFGELIIQLDDKEPKEISAILKEVDEAIFVDNFMKGDV